MHVHLCICVHVFAHVFAFLWYVCMVCMAKWTLTFLEKGFVAQHWCGASQQGTYGPQAGGVLVMEGSVELGNGGGKQKVGHQGMMGQLPLHEEQPGFLWMQDHSGSHWTPTHCTPSPLTKEQGSGNFRPLGGGADLLS